MGKINPVKNLKEGKKKLWVIISIFVRMRDKGRCFSCQKDVPNFYHRLGKKMPGWKACQAGHFITAANCGLALYFHEMNLHCQCHHCNINLSGNWLEYEKRMNEVYGWEAVDELKALKWAGKVIFKTFDYDEKIEHYTKKVKALEEKGIFYHDIWKVK